MNALWNKKNLERPANNIWVASRKAIDLKRFVSALESVIKDLDSQSVLHMEAAILSRLIYRMKTKFRSDKGLKNMEKVNRALLNYLGVQLHKEYKDLRNYVESDGRVVNLPTKQMVQYVLVRTQGFAKLMCRIENVAKCAAEFFKTRISIGHAWTISVIAYAVISRVWYLSRYLLKRCCAWYNGIFEHVSKFKLVGPVWLPDGYKLPENLKTWLNLPWIDRASDSVPLKDDGKKTIFGLIKGQTDDPSDLKFENEDNERSSETLNETEVYKDTEILNESSGIKNEVLLSADDIGMSIDREAFRLELSREGPKIQEPVESKKSLKRKKEKVKKGEAIAAQNQAKLRTKRRSKKSKVLVDEDIGSPVPVKRRKKVVSVDEKNAEGENDSGNRKKAKDQTDLSEPEEEREKYKAKNNKLKLLKSEKLSVKSPGEKMKQLTPRDIKTRGDLTSFLSKNSYPGLDRLQWNMMTNSIKKFVAKLEKCGPSDEKRQRILMKKVNSQIQNWIQ